MDGPQSQRVVHNMDSTEIPVYGEQEHSACDGHFESLLSPAGETCALLLVIAGGRTPEPGGDPRRCWVGSRCRRFRRDRKKRSGQVGSGTIPIELGSGGKS